MIRVTRLNSTPIVLNCDLIEHVQRVPDTMIALTNGKSFLVRETVEEVVNRVIEFRRTTRPLDRVCACPKKDSEAH